MLFPHIQDFISTLVAQGVVNFFISPGSRSSPLVLAVSRHPKAKSFVIHDERSNGFMALGFAQTSGKPVAIITTSGTAALNLAPALAEAFFQQVSVIALTADRPAVWINQQDGQAIFQNQVFGKNVKASFELPLVAQSTEEQDFVVRIANQAYHESKRFPSGPVHINIPLNEPLYPEPGEKIEFRETQVLKEISPAFSLPKNELQNLISAWEKAEKKLILVGQMPFNHDLCNALYALEEYGKIPILGDITANILQVKEAIHHADFWFAALGENEVNSLKPDILVSIGNGILSKNLKMFFRKNKPLQHWHIQEAGHVSDPFLSLTHIIRHDPTDFITKLGEHAFFITKPQQTEHFHSLWKSPESQFQVFVENTIKDAPWSDLKSMEMVLRSLPEKAHLHLANSMAVRYANFFSLSKSQQIKIFSNRGTSGIDGCTSTAVGASLATEKMVYLLTGDVAFFYDRNAFWNEYLQGNLKIVLFNNAGGNIFRMINGPANQPELEHFFEGKQRLNAASLAQEFGLGYRAVHNEKELEEGITSLHENSEKPFILEIFTDKEVNAGALKHFKSAFKNFAQTPTINNI